MERCSFVAFAVKIGDIECHGMWDGSHCHKIWAIYYFLVQLQTIIELNGVDYYATQLQGKWALPLIFVDSEDISPGYKMFSFRLLSRDQVKYKYELSFYLLGTRLCSQPLHADIVLILHCLFRFKILVVDSFMLRNLYVFFVLVLVKWIMVYSGPRHSHPTQY